MQISIVTRKRIKIVVISILLAMGLLMAFSNTVIAAELPYSTISTTRVNNNSSFGNAFYHSYNYYDGSNSGNFFVGLNNTISSSDQFSNPTSSFRYLNVDWVCCTRYSDQYVCGLANFSNSLVLKMFTNFRLTSYDYFNPDYSYYNICFTATDSYNLLVEYEKLSSERNFDTYIRIYEYSNNTFTMLKSVNNDSLSYDVENGKQYKLQIGYKFARMDKHTATLTDFAKFTFKVGIFDSNDIKLYKAGDDIITSWKVQDGMQFPYGASLEYTIVSSSDTFVYTVGSVFQGSQNSYTVSYRDLVGYDDIEQSYYISYVKITWQNRYEPIKKGVLQTPFDFYIKGNKVLDDVPAGLPTTHTVYFPSNNGFKPTDNIVLPSSLSGNVTGSNILLLNPVNYQSQSTVNAGLIDYVAHVSMVGFTAFYNGSNYDVYNIPATQNNFNLSNLHNFIGSFSDYYDYIYVPSYYCTADDVLSFSMPLDYLFISERVYLRSINDNLQGGFSSMSSGISQLLMNQDLTYKLFRSEFEYLNPLIDSMNNNLNVLPVIDNKVNGIESIFNNWVVSAGFKMDAILNAINGIGQGSGSGTSDPNDYSLIPDFESNLDMLNNQSLISYPLKFETDFYDALKAGYRDRFTFKFPAVSVPYRNNNMQLITEQQSAASESTFYPLDYMSSDMWTFLSSLFVFMLILGNIYFVFTAIMGGEEH